MRPVVRVFLYDEQGERFFGEGPCRLLKGVEQLGSLKKSADSMGMAYTKALAIIRRAERELGFSLTEKMIGGKGGGGSRLTLRAKEFLEKYEAYRDACYEADAAIYHQIFSEQ
ncbi:MAG: hypothetical protein HFI42_08220 [Lachnospiraceae bacterium]|nr:hypothetical protein [Lachnospiraceae bacterium]MCI9150474.1 hypothetical protein [Lachnospiraceae bacterium]